MQRSNLIKIAADQWIVMREQPDVPKAIIHRVTDTANTERFMVMVWQPIPADRRMVGIYDSLQDAEKSVPWPNRPAVPGPPGMSGDAAAANMRARGVDGTGMPPGVPHPARQPRDIDLGS